jgi:hypothetical protein
MIHNGPMVVFLSSSITNCCSMMRIFTLVLPKERSPIVKEGSLFCFCRVENYQFTYWTWMELLLSLCQGIFLIFCWLFAFVFSLGCVYLCFHLPCTFDGWIPSLIFIYKVFLFQELIKIRSHNKHSKIVDPSYGHY